MRFKKGVIPALAILGSLGVAAGMSTSAVAVNGTGNATIATAISVAEDAAGSLEFGIIAAGAGPGTSVVRIDTANTRSLTALGTANDAVLIGGGTIRSGLFNVTGANNASYTLNAIAATTLTGPGPAMALNNFTSSLGVLPATGTLDGTGNDSFTVGADLTVDDSATQTAGAYTGTYVVTVVYN